MNRDVTGRKRGRTWLRLLPYAMLLLPLAVLNLGFHFLASIELHWKERAQGEVALQELEALTRSSSFEYRLNRAAGQLADKLESALAIRPGQFDKSNTEQMIAQIAADSDSCFAELAPGYKLHVFRKTSIDAGAELFFVKSDKVESRRAMAMIFDYMVDLHRDVTISSEARKQRDKLAESYFGRTARSDAYARSQKGRTSHILHEERPHWFLWDYREIREHGVWGWFITAKNNDDDQKAAQKLALQDCRRRGNGLAGFIPVIDMDSPAVLFDELKNSQLFNEWRRRQIKSLADHLAYWVSHGPPPPARIGNHQIFTYLGKDSDHLTVFLSPAPKPEATPLWLKLLNLVIVTLSLLLSVRGLLLGHWLETGLTMRFMILYSLAATFPLGMLAVSAAAYHYQTSRSARSQIAENLEGCLRQIETRKMQIQEDYQAAARQMFTDNSLADLVERYGTESDAVKERVASHFRLREVPLPLLGFYLLDIKGEGTRYYEAANEFRLRDIFSVYRAPVIQNLRRRYALKNPGVDLPEFKVSEEETFGAQAFSALSGNQFNTEIEKRRNFCINQKTGDGAVTFIYDFMTIRGTAQAMLFFAWDSAALFEKSLQKIFENFRTGFPDYSFIAFRNTPQGLKIIHRPDEDLAQQNFSGILQVAENAVARGGMVSEHRDGFSVVAMPYGQESEIVIAGMAGHQQIASDESNRLRIFALLICISLIIAALCAYFTARFLLDPIGELKTSIEKISRGDYSVRLDSERADELGMLTREFAQMAEGVKERERLAALLSDHAVEALAEDSGNASDSDARSFHGIALVSDIRNFTTLCEKFPTDAITEMLNRHFAAMSEIISGHGGRIYKFIGDAIEAVFDESDARTTSENAVKAAVSMHAALARINVEREKQGLFTYAFGVGLARGRFYAGSVGSEETRLDYSIVSEAFHKAAQLEASTKHFSGIPVAFDSEIAALLQDIAETEVIDSAEISCHTFKAFDKFCDDSRTGFRQDVPARQAGKIQSADNDIAAQPVAPSRFRETSLALFAVLMVLSAAAVYYGFSLDNRLRARFSRAGAADKVYRLTRQVKAENAERVAFEFKMEELIENTEKELRFERRPEDARIISAAYERMVTELHSMGIEPSRFFATTDLTTNTDDPPRVAVEYKTNSYQKTFYHKLAHYLLLYFNGLNSDIVAKQVDKQMGEFFSTEFDAGHLAAEKIAGCIPVETADRTELFYWNFYRVFSDEMLSRPQPESNGELVGTADEQMRIAGILMFVIDQKQALGNPRLLVDAYSSPDCEIALISENGDRFHRNSFPVELLNTIGTVTSRVHENFLIEFDEITKSGKKYQLVAVAGVTSGNTDMTRLTILLIVFVALALAYFYRSLHSATIASRSIQNKLIFSILLTALVPMLTVSFISGYFIYENHQAAVQQQKLEQKRFIDEFEGRQYYINPVVTRKIHQISKSPQLLELAKNLEKNPESEEAQTALRAFLARNFRIINADDRWENNITTRTFLLLNRHNLDFRHNRDAKKDSDTLIGVLGQICRHIDSCINSATAPEGTLIKNVKNELYFDGAMQSLRSNFGDRSYIRLGNAIGQLVEFEVTTGAAGILIIPLPSLENPEFIAFWMISFTRGGYMTRIADHHLGSFAVCSIEYHRYAKLNRKYRPFPGLSLFNEAALIANSNFPVSTEKQIGNTRVSIEGRPGIIQFNSFLISAALQTPIEQATASIRRYLHYFVVLAILLFLLIGYQTSSDIMIPVRALSEGMQQIGRQNYFYRIALDRSDELGQLCASYDRFARGLAEKEMMGKMLSRSAQRAMAASAEAGEALAGSKREFVLLFVGSVDFAQRLSRENSVELFKKLNSQVAILCRIIIEQGGDIDKLMGDKILGIFEAEGGKAEAARQEAIGAAQKIMQAEQARELPFPVAIGVNAGEVISGMLGFGNKRDFTVIGDAVNVSARIEKEAEKMPGQRCLFSHDFVSDLSDTSSFKLHSEAALKGKSATLKLYRLT